MVTLTFDLLTLKVVSKSRVTWATSMPILVFLGLSVLDFGLIYATDVRQNHRLMPSPIGGGGIITETVRLRSRGYCPSRPPKLLPLDFTVDFWEWKSRLNSRGRGFGVLLGEKAWPYLPTSEDLNWGPLCCTSSGHPCRISWCVWKIVLVFLTPEWNTNEMACLFGL